MELRFWRTKKGEEVDLVLVKNRQPYPIEVKARWQEHAPPSGVTAFCRRYPSVKKTFTISANAQDSISEKARTHHFLTLEHVSRILDYLDT